jgi:hypothetical protein
MTLDFIKLSYMNMPCDWGVFRHLLSTVMSDVKSSLVEGHVPQKLSGYPLRLNHKLILVS